MNSMAVLNTLIMIGIIVAGFITVVVDDLLPCIISASVVGTFLAIEFLLLKAPDVAIAEGAVGAVLTPIIFIIALKKVQDKSQESKDQRKGDK